jgi:hypothetical protein
MLISISADPAPKLDLAPETDPASEPVIAPNLDLSHFFSCHSRPMSYLQARWHFAVHSYIFHLNKASSAPITLRTKKSAFFSGRLRPYYSTPFPAGVKNKKGKKWSNYFIFEHDK